MYFRLSITTLNKLEKHISFLLHDHNCVIIPLFGGVITNYSSARIDSISNKFYPPCKQISFNQNLRINDGLLVNYLSVQTGISYKVAENKINEWVVDLKAKLANGVKVSLEDIGTFFLDSENNLQFEPDKSVNYLRDSYGLREFFAASVLKEKSDEKTNSFNSVNLNEKELEFDTKIISIERRNSVKNILRYAAIALLIPMLTYSVWVVYNFEIFTQSNFIAANLNPFSEKICATYVKRHPVPESVSESSVFSPILFSNEEKITAISFLEEGEPDYSENDKISVNLSENNLAVPITTKVSLNEPPASYNFHVIGGCFRVYENAQNLVSNLQKIGFSSASIVDRNNGLFRVSSGGFASRDDAEKALKSARQKHNPNAWILVRN